MPDPNSPGLMVCEDDKDIYDPYRLPARQTERINLEFVRPDDDIALQPPPLPHFGFIVTEDAHPIVTESGEGIVTEDSDDL